MIDDEQRQALEQLRDMAQQAREQMRVGDDALGQSTLRKCISALGRLPLEYLLSHDGPGVGAVNYYRNCDCARELLDAFCASVLGVIATDLQDYQAAENYLRDAQRTFEAVSVGNSVMARTYLARLYVRQSRLIDAEAELVAAVTLTRPMHGKGALGRLLYTLAQFYIKQERWEEARLLIDEAYDIYISSEDKHDPSLESVGVMTEYAEVLRRLGEEHKARRMGQAAVRRRVLIEGS